MIIPRSYAVPPDLCQNEIKSYGELFRDVLFLRLHAPRLLSRLALITVSPSVVGKFAGI